MIRLVFPIRRLPGTRLEDFHRYWLERHAPLVVSHQRSLGILRYIQTHRVEVPAKNILALGRGPEEGPYDGVAELWYASEDAMLAAAMDKEGRRGARELLEDERTFIDLPSSPIWMSREYPKISPEEEIVALPHKSIVKVHLLVRQPVGMPSEEARQYWLCKHGPLVCEYATARGILRYQQVHRFESPIEVGLRQARGTVIDPYLGHDELWIDSNVLQITREAREADRAMIEDRFKFIDLARSGVWMGKEHVIINERRADT